MFFYSIANRTILQLKEYSMFFGSLQSLLSRYSKKAKRDGKEGRAKAMRRRLPLLLETLEDRTVPTVMFTPQFGFEHLSLTQNGDFNYTTKSDANVNLIFWGKFWGTAAGASQVTLLTKEAKGIIGSAYLSYLTQYGSNGFAQLQPRAFVDSSTNAPPGYSQAGAPASATTLQTEINSALNNSNSHMRVPAGNDTIATSPVYVVIVDPSYSDSNGGYNVPGTYTFSNGITVPINMISVGTNFTKTSKGVPTTTIVPDFFSETFSHELAERMSDPTEDGNGVGVSPGGLLPQNVVGTNSKGQLITNGQIGDFEPVPPGQGHYGYRVGGQNGILMQPYWADADHAFVVADGNKQSLTLTPKWTVTTVNPNLPPVPSNETGNFSRTYSLTIKGDQFRNGFADSIVINSTASGTQITLNGENFYFDAGTITDINVDARNGNDKIDVEATPVGLPIFIDTGAGDDDVIISRDAKLFSNVAGNVTVVGYNTDNDRLIINDQADTATNPSFKVTSGTVQQFGVVIPGIGTLNSGLIRYNGIFRGGVIVNGGSGGNTFTVDSTHAFPTTLNTGTGPDNVYVHGTTGSLTVNGQGGSDNVAIGINRSVAGIGRALTVTNSGGYSAVSVDDSADNQSRAVILYSNGTDNVLSGFPTGGDILLRRGQLSGLAIYAGSKVVNGTIVGGNTFRIHDTPTNSTAGGVTTTINTGAGPDNVTIDGTTGTLTLNVQDSGSGTNFISVGSALVNLDRINGPINITGLAGAENDLSIIDSASHTSHQYVIDRNFVQRGGRARIGYENMSQLTVRTAAQPDHITVQDTAPFALGRSTSIPLSGGNDVIDVLRTTGTLLIDAGGTSAINVGDPTSSLDNIQGVVGLAAIGAGNQVTLSLNDQAATTPQQLDITSNFFGFAAFRRSGAADINFLSSSLYKFSWQSGSGGTNINQFVRPAQFTNYILGNDVLTIGTKAGTVSNFGPITVTGGIGPDAVILNDSGETRPQTYNVSVASGHEMFAARGTTLDLGPNIETFEVKGGAGGNNINIAGTIAGMSTILHTGTGSNTVTAGGPANSLDAIQGPVTLDGQGVDQVAFNDQGTTTKEGYSLAVDQLTRTEATGVAADMAPISFAGFAAITLNIGSGGSAAAVYGSLAGSTVTVNGNPGGPNQFAVDASTDAIQGPVIFNGQNGSGDFAQYYDIGNAAPHTYTLTSTSVSRDGLAPVFSNVGMIVYAAMVGGNTVNVNSVAFGGAYKIQAANGDHVTVGSMAPGLGGTLADILDQVNVVSYTPSDAVTLVLDDSGNTDTTVAKHITFSGPDADGNVTIIGLTPIGLSWRLPSASSVTVRDGAANTIFSMQSIVAATPLTLVGGTGSNTLDYSSFVNYPGLVSWYRGEGNASDVTGANPGVLHNGVSYAPGIVGQAFGFNGVDGYVDLGNNPSLDIPGSLTTEAWVNYQTLPHFKYLLADFDPSGTISQGSLGILDNHFFWFQSMTDGSSIQPSGATTLVAGQWYHVAVVRDDVAKTVTLYVNGAVDGSASYGGTVVGLQQTKVLGTSEAQGFPDDFFNGLIDEPSIYNRALSATEVQAVFAAGSAGKPVQPGVYVNLQTGTATALAGISDPNTGRITIQNVIGSSGNDTLIAGADRSILIGGGGADQLFGGSGEAILIAGTSDYTQPTLNVAALDVILQEWNRTDLGFGDRMSDLLTGSNSQGFAANNVIGGTAILLDSTTVHDDFAANVLTGGTGLGLDWYLIGASDLITNQKPGDGVTMV
jgi:hypothetical protein